MLNISGVKRILHHQVKKVVFMQEVVTFVTCSQSKTHVFVSLSIRHAAVQAAVLEAPQVAVIHENIQDRCHLTED